MEYNFLNFKKLPSDSSASTTAHSSLPTLALASIELRIPPLTIVGLYFELFNIVETKDVIVVLPCEPEIIIFFF